MSLDEEYPKTFRRRSSQVHALLERVSDLSAEDRLWIADAISSMADKARDLDEITDRLLNEPHSASEIGDLLIAFELTTEQLRGYSDVIDGKLYEIADRLKGVVPTATTAE